MICIISDALTLIRSYTTLLCNCLILRRPGDKPLYASRSWHCRQFCESPWCNTFRHLGRVGIPPDNSWQLRRSKCCFRWVVASARTYHMYGDIKACILFMFLIVNATTNTTSIWRQSLHCEQQHILMMNTFSISLSAYYLVTVQRLLAPLGLLFSDQNKKPIWWYPCDAKGQMQCLRLGYNSDLRGCKQGTQFRQATPTARRLIYDNMWHHGITCTKPLYQHYMISYGTICHAIVWCKILTYCTIRQSHAVSHRMESQMNLVQGMLRATDSSRYS